MPKSANQKLKILYIAQMLLQKTDETHELSVQEIIDGLEAEEISAERKSIYDDIRALTDFGLDIVRTPGPHGGYHIASREFELAEVKLLVDLVQSSKFITEKKSRELIRKLEKLASSYEASSLQRQVVVADRNKTANESIYYSVDVIHSAIAANSKIRFQYYEWDTDKTMKFRKNGDFYEVSPWILTWDDENYYMVAYDDEAERMKHYRVDKMVHPEVANKIRKGRAQYDKIDIAGYTERNFGMFSGENRTVQLLCSKGLTGVVIDRFGTDVALRVYDEERVLARAEINVSPQFYGWVTGFGNRMQIAGPADVAADYQDWLKEILAVYDAGGENR